MRKKKVKKILSVKVNLENTVDDISNVDKIYYINLKHRKDRKESILNEIKKMDPTLEKTIRIDAVNHEKGCIGCGLSHIKALTDAIENKYENIIILEDDFIFTSDINNIKKKINYIITDQSDYNICLLAGNICSKRIINNIISSCRNVQTTSGYLINKKFFNLLKEVFIYGVKNLLEGKNPEKYSIDIVWKKLQNDKFYIFTPKLGKQIESYSDIEKRNTDYGC